MNIQDLAALITGIATGLAGVATMVHFLVKHYLAELKPNGGGSMKDQVNRLEVRVDTIIEMLKK
jgi:hypothetical protein